MSNIILAAIAVGFTVLLNGLALAYSYGRLGSRVDALEKAAKALNGLPITMSAIQQDVSNISTHVAAMNTEMGQLRDHVGDIAQRVANIEGRLRPPI